MTAHGIVTLAANFAFEAHKGQRRKYTGDPYYEHVKAVARTVTEYGGTPEMVAAAYLHDVVEDTATTFAEVLETFGPAIGTLVYHLTDEPMKGNRASRVAAHRSRLAEASDAAQTIKLADLLDNTATIVAHDPAFARVYLREKSELLKVLNRGNVDLWVRCAQQVQTGLNALASQ